MRKAHHNRSRTGYQVQCQQAVWRFRRQFQQVLVQCEVLVHSQPVEPTGEGRSEISPLLDSVRVSEAGSELVEASKVGRRRSRCHASCISNRWRPPHWEIAECSVCIIEQSGFERVFHVQSLFDADCPAHFEGSIQEWYSALH